jgi:hypothetical protein
VYGKSILLPIEFEIKILRTTLKLGLDLSTTHKGGVQQLNALDEIGKQALFHIEMVQHQ